MTDDETQKMNIERLRNYSNALYSAVTERYKILPLISTLSAALVGLVIQHTELVKTQTLVFISLIIFLILIPLSVFVALYQSGQDIEILADRIENILLPIKNQKEDSNFIIIFPWILFFFFSIAIVLMILSFFNLK